MHYVVSTVIVESSRAEWVCATAESILSQAVGPDDRLSWYILCPSNAECTGTVRDLAEVDPRIDVEYYTAGRPELHHLEWRNVARAATADALRFVHAGQTLLPTAAGRDITDLKHHRWVASVALDDVYGTVTGPHVQPPRGEIPHGVITDQWSAVTPQITVHPMAVAYSAAEVRRLGSIATLPYGVHTELLAVINERHRGWFRPEPSMLIPTHWLLDMQDRRPADYLTQRKLRASSLIGQRGQQLLSGPALWEAVADEAWPTRDQGHVTDVTDTDTLREVLVQARRYHYRFDWWRLRDYAGHARARWDDDYLKAMYATAVAAAARTSTAWTDCMAVIDSHRQCSKIVHLFLTVVFESTDVDDEVLDYAITAATDILAEDGDNPVLHYRLVSFNRRLGRVEQARNHADVATQMIRNVPPGLADHLRERLLLEKSLMSNATPVRS